MSNKYLNFLFFILFFISSIITMLCFFTWNDPFFYEVNKDDSILKNVEVERCKIDDSSKRIKVEGWAFVDGVPNISFSVFAETNKGTFKKLETFALKRPDVNDSFKLDDSYKMTGFKASHYGMGYFYTGNLVVKAINSEGDSFSADKKCLQ